MPFYNSLDPRKGEDHWTAVGLLRLRKALRRSVPPKKMDSHLLLATWNIREFGGKKFKRRSKEALFYLADVISAFDLVAVQEVRSNLGGFNRLMSFLGSWWRYLLTGVTIGRRGNEERLAFLYDSRKVTFGGLASQLVLPPLEGGHSKRKPAEQLARTPLLVGFRSGWSKFTVCTGQILYGKGVACPPERVAEIRKMAQFLAQRATDPDSWARNMIVLGDFNIFKPKDQSFARREVYYSGTPSGNAFKRCRRQTFRPNCLHRARSGGQARAVQRRRRQCVQGCLHGKTERFEVLRSIDRQDGLQDLAHLPAFGSPADVDRAANGFWRTLSEEEDEASRASCHFGGPSCTTGNRLRKHKSDLENVPGSNRPIIVLDDR